MHDIRHAIPAIRILWTENVPRIPPPFRPISSPGIHHAPRPWGALLANRHSHHNFDTLGPEGSGRTPPCRGTRSIRSIRSQSSSRARACRRLDGKRGTERGGRTVQRFNWWHRIASSSCWLLRSGRSDMHSVGGRHLSPQAPLSTGTSMPRWPTFLQIACGLRPGGCSYPIDSYTRTPKGWLMDTP